MKGRGGAASALAQWCPWSACLRVEWAAMAAPQPLGKWQGPEGTVTVRGLQTERQAAAGREVEELSGGVGTDLRLQTPALSSPITVGHRVRLRKCMNCSLSCFLCIAESSEMSVVC